MKEHLSEIKINNNNNINNNEININNNVDDN